MKIEPCWFEYVEETNMHNIVIDMSHILVQRTANLSGPQLLARETLKFGVKLARNKFNETL